jgi:hypothetical protein
MLRAAVLAAALVPALAGEDSVYRTLRDASVTDARVAENIVLRRDNGILTLKNGSIGFTAPAEGRDTVAVFSGEGAFSFQPALKPETEHLKGVLGQEALEETFDRALLCFTDKTADEIRGQAKTKTASPKLDEILKDFRKHLRLDSRENIEAELLADIYRPAQPGFFTAYLHGRKHEDLRFAVKPRGALPSLSPEEVVIIDADETSEQRGIWYSAHFKQEIESGAANSDEDKRVVEAESYKIDTTIAKNDRFTASTVVRLHAVTEGDRVIHFGLLPTLRVAKVSIDGRDTPFIQEDRRRDGDFYVVMPQPMTRGAAYELAIDYTGDKVVHKEGGGNFSVGAREEWYPSVNTFHDHARYDLTFRVPKEYTLVSVGALEKQWTEQGMACSHWIASEPVAVAGFNYGSFKKHEVKDVQSGVTIEGYAAMDAPDYLKDAEKMAAMGTLSPSRLMDGTLVEAQNALRLFGAWFGKPPYPRIAITQQPEFNFGQSWPTLVYLPMSAYLDSTQRWQLMGRIQNRLSEFVDEVTAHEVSHQWWGHEVGWSTYHDQWLSEGFAFFSAGLYLQATQKNNQKYVEYWDHARQMLLEKNQFGRRANDAGPVWIGLRLATPKTAQAYNAVVYRKGGYVLNMLRALMYDSQDHDKAFMQMMHDFVEEYRNRNASTESFARLVEKHIRPVMNAAGNGRMDWFFRQWVYGTAIPKYKFDYTVTPTEDGQWLLKANLTQSEVPQDFIGMMPLYADFDGAIARLGVVRVVGSATNDKLQAKLPKKPKKVAINLFHDMLEQ